MDGNYSGTFDIRMSRADSLVWLDHPRNVCIRRVLIWIIKGYGRTRADLPEGCPEHVDIKFLRYVWKFRRKHRQRIVAAGAQFGQHLRVIRIDCDRDMEKFLADVGTP